MNYVRSDAGRQGPRNWPGDALLRLAGTSLGVQLVERAFAGPSRARLACELADPWRCQRELWERLVRRAAGTQFGRDHAFARIRSIREYQRRVPVRQYEDFLPYLKPMLRESRPDVLWPGRVRWFAESSGTSGGKKQIPLPDEAVGTQYRGAAKTYVAELLGGVDPHGFLRGKTVFFVGTVRSFEPNPRVLLGDVTGLNVHLTPWYLDWLRAPDKATTLLKNWEEKLARMAERTLDVNVVHLAGMPPWLLHFGRIVLELTGRRALREVWPHLMLTTVGGVHPAPYLPGLNRLILGQDNAAGTDLRHVEVYNATEGFFAMQRGDDADLTFMPNAGIFYEFVPRQDAAAGHYEQAVTLPDVAVGVDYAPVLTSMNGLWRYLVGDTVRFTCTRPYKLLVSGRIHQFLNIAGEELIVANTDAALQALCERHGMPLTDYTVTALKTDAAAENAFHLWLVELAQPVDWSDAEFAQRLDAVLQAGHYDYAKVRQAGQWTGIGFGLGPPAVLLLAPGSFHAWLRSRHGVALGPQSKAPRLSAEPSVASALVAAVDPLRLAEWMNGLPAGYRTAVERLSIHSGDGREGYGSHPGY